MSSLRCFSSLLRAGVVAVALLLPLAQGLAAGSPPQSAKAPFTVDDLLLLETTLEGQSLTDSLGAYSSRAGLYLPVGELSRLLDLPLQVDPPQRMVSGWFLSPTRRLLLKLDEPVAESDGKRIPVGPGEVVLLEGEIYVRQDLLSKLLPLDFKAELSSLTLRITARERLPAQERLARELRRRTMGAGGGNQAPPLRVAVPYELFTKPAFDANVSVAAADTEPHRNLQWDLRMAGDVAYTGAQAYVASDATGALQSARVQLERRIEYGANADGTPKLWRMEGGDVFTPSLALGLGSHGGRGFSVTNAPLEQASVFDQVNLRGELPPGYEVELYVNEGLRASQATPVNGRYEFLNVPLVFGLNVVRLAFYGPRGERYEEVRRLNVGGGQLSAGQWVSSFGAVQQGTDLITLRNGALATPPFDPGYGKLQYTGSLAYGLNSNITLRGGYGQYEPAGGPQRQVFESGLAAGLGGFALQVDAAADSLQGKAESLGLAGRLFSVPVLLHHAEYQGGFVDELQAVAPQPNNPLVRASELRLDYSAHLPGSARMFPLSFDIRRQEREDGANLLSGTGRLSAAAGWVLLSTDLSLSENRAIGQPVARQLGGSVDLASLGRGRWQFRTATTYSIEPQLQLLATTVSVDRRLSSRNELRLGIQQSWTQGKATALTAANTWRLPSMDLTTAASYSPQSGQFTLNLQVSMGTLFDPLRGAYRSTPPGAASSGALAIDAFIDRNGDGQRQADEPAVAGLGAFSARGLVSGDAQGHLLVGGLGDTARTSIGLRLDSIEDPFLIPPATRIELQPRAGRVVVVPFPLRPMGDVALRVLIALTPEVTRGISALAMQLVDAAGTVVAHGRTEYDGTVLFEGLPPGQYGVRLDPEQGARLKLQLTEQTQITISPQGGFAGTHELRIQSQR